MRILSVLTALLAASGAAANMTASAPGNGTLPTSGGGAPPDMVRLAVPMKMGPIQADYLLVPKGDSGSGELQTRAFGSGSGVFANFGAFRLTCHMAKYAFDDPVVYPGKPGASHLHLFFGNTSTDAYSTSESISSTGNGTCAGGTANRTGYWMPAVLSADGSRVIPPDDLFTVYYKSGLHIDYRKIATLPTGLRMISGLKDWKGPGPQTEKPQGYQFVTWECRDRSVDVQFKDSGHIPDCRIGDAVHLTIEFPQCWDGKHLDSPDHKSHMARAIYDGNVEFASKCPSSHPVILPQITEIFDFPVTKDNAPSSSWRLSSDLYDAKIPGGYSAHADWMMGWDPATIAQIVRECINKGNDCGVNFIGSGTEVYFKQP